MGRETSIPRRPKPLDLTNGFIMVPDSLTPGRGPTGLLTPATTALSQPTPASTINIGLDGHRTISTSIVGSEQSPSTGTHPAHGETNAKPIHGVKKNPTPPYEPIAIIGMGMRLPGGVHDDASYWDLLVNGKDGLCRVPESRYHAEAWVQPPGSSKPSSVALAVPSTHGYFLAADADGSDPLRRLDGSFWSLGRHEAEALDPQQRLFLEVVHEALETAGLTPSSYRGADVGMYVGQMCDDWAGMQRMDRLDHSAARAEVVGDYIVANRASYEFDLRGPSVVVRTACSSSLVALHMACRDLQAGVCGAAVVGGVNVMVTPRDTIGMNAQGVLSPSGRCMAFDADADGYARGEGVSAICVKRLDDALRDGDPVRAVIRASCVSNDGQGGGQGITSPDGGAHERIMRKAYEIAEIGDLGRTAMVECHGTGTAVGDPVEAGAVAKLWGKDGIYIGSVKGNIGHGEGASGLSSLMKMVLALEHSTIPPNIHFNTPNPRIPWEDAKLTVPTKAIPWPADRLERVSVNSFGIGGTNAHIILESASCAGVLPRPIPDIGVQGSENADDASSHRLLVFSAKHPKALERSAEAVRNYLADHPAKLGDMAYSLAAHREAYSQRAFALVGPDEAGSFRIDAGGTAPEKQPSLAWVFTGQGAQWAQMGKELLEKEPLVRQRVEHFDRLLASLSEPPSFTIEGEIMKPQAHSRLYEAQYSQPCMVALQLAIVDLLKSWGVKPAVVVGHSSGETAAAYAAGAVTADDAFLLAYHRGQITPTLARAHDGGMAAVGLGRDAAAPFLRPGVIIGCENSPESVTLSGEKDVLTSVMAAISAARPDVLCRRLKVECGYHSQHMTAVADEYWSRVTGPDGVRGQAVEPTIAFYSSVNAGPTKDLSPRHFLDNLLSPVLFDGAVRALLRDLPTTPVFVEIGPHAALAGPIRQIVQSEAAAALNQSQNRHRSPQPQKEAQHAYIPTLVRGRDGMVCLLETAGKLWLAGAAIQPRAVNPPGGSFLRDMPTYQWHYEGGGEHWRETRMSREWRLRRFPHHELLGSRCVETGDACPAWRCRLSPADDAPWLREHVVRGSSVLPAAAFVVMVGEALRQLGSGGDGFSLKSMVFSAPLALDRDETIELITTLMPMPDGGEDGGWYHFSISSIADIKSGGACTQHATGRCAAGARFQLPAPDTAASTASLVRQVNHGGFYNTWQRFGLDYGPSFQRIKDARSHVSERRATATIDTSCAPEGEDAYYQAAMHPTSLDAAFHACMMAGCVGLERNFEQLAVPHYIDEVYLKPQAAAARAKEMTVVAEAFERADGVSCSNVFGASKTGGEILLHVRGLEATPLPDEASPESPANRHLAAVLEWKPDLDFDNSPYWITPDKRQYKAQVKILMELLGHKTPAMRILEIETQHGANMTDTALQALKSGQGKELYSEYVLASGSDASSKVARERFGQTAGMRFAKANLTPEGYDLAQALETPAPFDLVILNSCDSDSLKDLLQAIRPLLSPRGRLIISDTVATRAHAAAGDDDATADRKSVGEYKQYMGIMSSLRRALFAAGFLTQREVVYNYGASTVMAGPAPPPEQQQQLQPFLGPKTINVLARSTWSPRVSEAAAQLRSRGYEIQWFLPGQLLPTHQTAVSFLDLDEERGPFLHGMGADDLAALKISILSLQGTDGGAAPQMLWVTGAAQVRCDDPRWALVLGFARSVRRETGVDLVTLELEAFDAAGWAAVARLLDGFDARWRDDDEDDGVDPESEYVFSGGEIQIGRFHSVDLPEKLLERTPDGDGEGKARKVLAVSKHDSRAALEWKREAAATGDRVVGNTVQVQVRAFALSPSGLQAASEASLASTELGFLASGVISAVGPHVDKLGAGDRVVIFASGSAATSVQAPEEMCFRIRDDMEFEEAVKLPLLEYCSAFHSLDTVAGLEQGQSILIHRAETPVGRAALEVALERYGSRRDQIFATVTNAAEAEEVITKFHLAGDRIFVSGSTASFLRSVTEATGGKGVDIVLSTFADPKLVAASWKCLAPYGHLVQLAGWEASPRTHSSGEQLGGIDVLRESKTFSRVDLAQVLNRRPHSLYSHLRKAMAHCRTGNAGAGNRHIKILDGDSIKDGIKLPRSPSEGTSLLMAKLPEDVGMLRVAPARRKLALRPDRTYIIVGGVGGLGIPCARFLAERGARRLILFSRSAERFAARSPLLREEFEAMGCRVKFVSGSISQAEDVEKLMAAAETPVGGIIHSAMVLQDSHLANLTYRQWRDVIDAKVQGTWNLHSAAGSQPLDFFVLFSSLAGLGGQVGQANYAAANAFQDAFVQHRRARGLACSALDIGIMEGVGILAREAARLEALLSVEHHVLHERELLDALELAILDDETGGGGGNNNNINNGVARRNPTPPVAGYVSAGQMAIGLGATASGHGLARQSAWRRDPRMQMGRYSPGHDADEARSQQQQQKSNSGAQQLADALARDAHEQTAASREALTRTLALELATTVRQLTMRDGDGDDDGNSILERDAGAPMRSLGVDSLVSVELRGWLRRRVKVALSVQDVRGAETLADLARLATQKAGDARGADRHSSSRLPVAVPGC